MNCISWINSSSKFPCPICNKQDWCSISSNGEWVICRRVNTGDCQVKYGIGGEYYLYRLPIYHYQELLCSIHKPILSKSDEPIDLEKRAKVYSKLLEVLTLSGYHEEKLLNRGFSKDEIVARQYKTLPSRSETLVLNHLQTLFADEDLTRTPGFSINNSKIILSSNLGMIIPCRDINNKIFSLKIRSDISDSANKYFYLSSRAAGGPRSISSIHYPINRGSNSEVIRITEGELKADLCSIRTNIYTIALPGVTNTGGLLSGLRELNPRKVEIAFDMDIYKNPQVRRALSRLYKQLEINNYKVEVLKW